MKIAIDCRSVFPGRGGIGRYAESLARGLAQVDTSNEYLLLVTERQSQPIAANGQVQQVAFQATMIDEVWEQLHLPSILAEYDVDLYHNPCFSLPVVKTTRWRIATVHDVVFRTYPQLVDARLRSYLDRWSEHALEVGDAIITSSEFSKSEIVKHFGTPPEKIHVIYHGVDPSFRRRVPGKAEGVLRTKYGLSKPFVLYVGSLEAKKNIDRLLEALALLVSDGRAGERVLALVGGRGGNDYDVEAAIQRAGVKERVVVTGYVTDEDVVILMNLADLFVYPSLYEGFGLPPLEAMACGTPTVVSQATSLPEVVGDGALVAPAEDVEALATQMARLLNDPELRRTMSERGRKRAETFTWERAARGTLELYESLDGAGR